MNDSIVRPDATNPDGSRPIATTLDTDFILTIEQVADIYAKAGRPRTIRSLQRYCAKGHLDSQKKETALGGEIYLVTPQCQTARNVDPRFGVHPCGWTGSGCGFDHLPGMLLLKLGGAPVSERRVEPLAIVDLIDEARH